jgi:transcription antitermination factor NusG
VPIDDGVVEQLRLRCDERGVVHVSASPWNPGDRVEIADGPFAGLLATVETVMPRQRRIKLLIDFLARQTCVDMPLTAIRGLGGSRLVPVPVPGRTEFHGHVAH